MIAELTEQLKKDEGFSRSVYQDSLGYWTIGYGRLVDKRMGGGITEEEAEYLLNNDILSRLASLSNAMPWFNNLNDARKGALVNMSFQLGVEGLLGFKKTLGLLKVGKYADAAEEMLRSRWALQTPSRAYRMAEQIETGRWVL